MNDDLRNYITEMLTLSYDYSFIKEELLRAGWDESSIEKAMHDYREAESDNKNEDDRQEELFLEQVAKPGPEEALEIVSESAREKETELEESVVQEPEDSQEPDGVEEVKDATDSQREERSWMGKVSEKPETGPAQELEDEAPRGADDLKHPPKERVESAALPKKSKNEKKQNEPTQQRKDKSEKHSIAVPAIAGLLSLGMGALFGYYYLAQNFYDLSMQPVVPEESIEMLNLES